MASVLVFIYGLSDIRATSIYIHNNIKSPHCALIVHFQNKIELVSLLPVTSLLSCDDALFINVQVQRACAFKVHSFSSEKDGEYTL